MSSNSGKKKAKFGVISQMPRPLSEFKATENGHGITDEPVGRSRQGFTLVELLIVLAITAVLAVVVMASIAGAFQRGSEQAYASDRRNIQSAISLFYFDGHACDIEPASDSWDSSQSPVYGHYYPTATGAAATKAIEGILADANAAGSSCTFPAEAIWMGLLVNSPSATSGHDRDGAAPLLGETGPYLNEIPASASSNNHSKAEGSYTWVIAENGLVYGVYWNGSAWQYGYSATSP